MTRLVIRRVAALFFGHDHAFALGTHQNLVLGLFEVLHLNHAGTAARCHQCGFVAQVGEVSTRHAGRATGNDVGADVLAQRHFTHVNSQDLLAPADVRQRHIHLAVKTARAQQGGVQNVRAVGGSHHNHADIGFKAIHLNQHLVQGLFALVIAATQAGAALAADCVNLINEDDARRVFLGVLKHVAHTGRADTDEHFNEVRAGDREERNLGLAGNAFGQQGLAGARRADQEQTTRNASAEFLKLGRVFEEVNHFFDFFLGFVATGNVCKSHGVGGLVKHAGFAFAEAESPALAATLHLAHKVNPHADQQQHRSPADQQGHEERAFFTRLDIELDVVGNQVTDQTTVQVGGGGTDAAVIGGDSNDFSAALTFRDGG